MNDRPHKQEDVEPVILQALSGGGTLTTQEVMRATKARLVLTDADKQRANERDEMKINQIIANALQSRRNLCKQGLIERVGEGAFRITSVGRAYLKRHDDNVASMTEELDQLLSNPKVE